MQISREVENAGAFGNVSQRLLHQAPAPHPPDESQRVIEKLLGRSRFVLHLVRRAAQAQRELVDLRHQFLRVSTFEQILVQSAVDEDQLLLAGGAGIVKLLRHPGGTNFVGGAVDDESGDGEIVYDIERVEEPAADEVQRHAWKRDARDVGQVRERRLQNEA